MWQAQTERFESNGQREPGEGRPEPPLVHPDLLQEVDPGQQRGQAHHLQVQGWGGEDCGDQPDIPPDWHRQQAAPVDEGGEAVGGRGGGRGGGGENQADCQRET